MGRDVAICSFAVLQAARKIVDYSLSVDLLTEDIPIYPRPVYSHLGAVLADSILQAGLNYRTVVAPRVRRILQSHPEAANLDGIMLYVVANETSNLLQWKHHTKVKRFNDLSYALFNRGIVNTDCLRESMADPNFISLLSEIGGIGPKTIDYLSCLVGIDAVAVDRHIRSFSKEAGVFEDNYHFLRYVFHSAADLLSIPRRQLDHVVWKRQASYAYESLQLELL